MAWNEQEAKKRVDDNDFHDFEVTVADLARSMDFANLGTKDVRRAEAAHIYADVPNFHLSVSDAGGDKSKQKKLLRAASTLRKIQGDMLKAPDIIGEHPIGHIQCQGARLHALSYRPYADQATRAINAVTLAISLNTYIYEVFNPLFSDLSRNFQSAVGIAAGRCLIANIGFHGDRERICLGTPANLAAKVLGRGNTITITSDVYDVLPDELKDEFSASDDVAGAATYQAKALSWTAMPDLAESLNVEWDGEEWRKKTECYRDELCLDDMEVSWAATKIDVDILTERNSRRTDALAIYADLDGFTRYVQEAEKDDSVVSLVRELHMIRHELHAVLKQDYPGIVLQHQGDRILAILHEPCGDDDADHEKRCRKALDAAIGLQSSMQHVLRTKLPGRKDLYLAVGLDVGIAIVTRLGKKGKREVICLGPEVSAAERLQLKSSARQIRVSEPIYSATDREAIKKEFRKDGDSYVADSLTWPKIDERETEKAAAAGALGARTVEDRVEFVYNNPRPQKPWAQE
jgi:class 3 adenylate cyclase